MSTREEKGPFATTAKTLTQRLTRGGAWVVGARSAGMAVVLGIYAYLARVMPTEGFAGYVLISSVAVFFSMAATFGLNTLACRYLSESFAIGDSQRARTAMRLTVQLGGISVLAIGGLSWLAISILGRQLQMAFVEDCALLVAVWIMLLAVNQILAESFRGLHDLRMAALLSGVSGGVVSNGLFLALTLIAGLFAPSISFTLVVGMSITSLLISCVAAGAYFAHVWPQSSSDPSGRELTPLSVKTVIHEAIPVMMVQAIGFGLAQLDIWIVAACCDSHELATYGIIRRLSLLIAIPLTQISMVVASSISELYARGDRERLQRILTAAATVSFLVVAIPAVALALVPGPVLAFVFGDGFRSGANPLRILLLGQLAFALTGPCGPTLMMTGRQRASLWSLVATLPLYVFAPAAAASYGLSAVALVFAISTALQNIVQWLVVRRLIGIDTQPCFTPSYVFSLLHFRLGSESLDRGTPVPCK